MNHPSRPTVAIIGAGPFGVSVAAHVRSAGIDFRIFGKPMYRWRCQMPKGMFLKSEGCASNLSDPAADSTLARYFAEHGLLYGPRGMPISLELFTRYALSFQRDLVPGVEEVMVTGVEASNHGFELQLADGTTAEFGKVIVATGLENAAQIPPSLAGLPRELLSHSADHHDLSRFQGRNMVVIGGGQSALETAALLSEAGAEVHLLVRGQSLEWNATPRMIRRSPYERLRYPVSNLGEGFELWAYSTAPMLFRHLPPRLRFEKVKSILGPAGAWWLKDRVYGQLKILTGYSVQGAEVSHGRALLRIAGPDRHQSEFMTDHVIAATGYRFEVQRLPFLSQKLKAAVRTEQQMPVLASGFESSVPGLYFTGLASAYCFGPAMRFLHGADYTARRITRHLNASRRKGTPAFHPVRARKCGEF